MFHFEEELKKLPAKPGVYIMHDKDDAIIYVGKAISLRNRVRSYFRESTNKSPKIEKMVTKDRPLRVYCDRFGAGGAGAGKQPDQRA